MISNKKVKYNSINFLDQISSIQLDDGEIQRESPIYNPRQNLPRVVAEVGGLESAEFYRQSKAFIDFWNDGGSDGTFRVREKCDHFSIVTELADKNSGLSKSILNFVNTT